MALDDGEWSSADEFFEMVLNQKFDCAEAYLGKTMATFKIKTKSQLMEFILQIQDDNNFKRTLNFADDTLKSELEKMKLAKDKQIEEENLEKAVKERRKAEANQNRLKTAREKISPFKNLISAGCYNTVGIKTDGTAVSTKFNSNHIHYHGQCDVSNWKDISVVSAGLNHTVGLKSDGTVVLTENYPDNKDVYYGQYVISNWRDIVSVSAGSNHIVGLKSDGTVVVTGLSNSYCNCDVSDWRDIVAISAGDQHTVGLKLDGTVITSGRNYFGQCDVLNWNLFKNVGTSKVDLYKKQGLCQYCGGQFKGLFSKMCSKCGKFKDY